MLFFFFFFFSSRRRHTRSKRDWSSDVCSSDLVCCTSGAQAAYTSSIGSTSGSWRPTAARSMTNRSEERRVGKECRARGAGGHVKKKEGRWRDEGREKG